MEWTYLTFFDTPDSDSTAAEIQRRLDGLKQFGESHKYYKKDPRMVESIRLTKELLAKAQERERQGA